VAFLQAARDALETGMSPQHLAERVFDAIRKEQLYILTHPEFIPVVQQRSESILEQRNPVSPETIVSRLLATTPEGRRAKGVSPETTSGQSSELAPVTND